MATKTAETEKAAEPVKKAKATGTLAKPVYLIHHGNFTAKVAATTQERVVSDENDPQFGEVVTEEVTPEHEVKGALPKGSRFGNRKIGVAHEVTSKAEAEAMKARGFVEATEAEIKASEKTPGGKSLDDVAAAERVRAEEKLRRFEGNVTSKRKIETE